MRIVLLLALLVLPACRSASTALPKSVPDLDLNYPVGAFTLTERNGSKVSAKDLQGKVWIASFVFTRCTGPCPAVTGTMARLQKELADLSDLRLVTFTVDPEHDDPKELTNYANHFRADPERWLFLTGPETEIHRLIRDNFKVGVTKNEKPQSIGEAYDHSTRLAVVDRQGIIRAFFRGIPETDKEAEAQQDFETNLQKLREKVTTLLKE